MSNSNDPTVLANIAAMAVRAKVAMIDLANLIEKQFSVKVKVCENPNLDRSLATFRGACKWRDIKADKVWFGNLEFKIGSEKFDLRFHNFGEARCIIEKGWRGFKFHEKKDGFDLSEVVKNIESHVTNAKASQDWSAKQAEIKAAGEKIAAEIRPILEAKGKDMWCPGIQVHIGNETPVFALTMNLNEENLRKVAALLATF
jgi:hypothetical protein